MVFWIFTLAYLRSRQGLIGLGFLQGCCSHELSPCSSDYLSFLLLTRATEIWVWSALKSYPFRLWAEMWTPCLVCAGFWELQCIPWARLAPSLFRKLLNYSRSILLVKETHERKHTFLFKHPLQHTKFQRSMQYEG